MRYLISLLLLTMTLLFVPGCSDNSPTSSSDGMGVLKVLFTDSPGDFDEVNITIEEVSVHKDSSWVILNENEQTHNLIELANGITAVLGEEQLDPGIYDQIRLKIKAAELKIDDDIFPLDVPSGAQSGLKLHGNFTIEEGILTELVIDFDVAKSIHEIAKKQEYKLNPSLRVIAKSTSGAIIGHVTNPENEPVVFAIAGSDTVTSSIVDPQDGNFMLSFLPSGTYTVAFEDTLNYKCEVSNTVVSIGNKENLGDITLALE